MAASLRATVLVLGGLLAFAISLRGLLAPEALGAGLSLNPQGADGLNEIRAQYGGFFLAIAIVCALSLFRRAPAAAGLILLAATFGGVLLGRIVSLGIDGFAAFAGYSPTIKALFVVDAAGLALSLAALAVRDTDRSREAGS